MPPSFQRLLSLFLLLAPLLASGCSETPDLVLNEFVASNGAGVADESGAFPDWIELHNPTNEAISLDGWFLSDDLGNPTRHALPSEMTVEAGGFVVFFADGDTDDGDQHLGFRLSAEGEEVVLTHSEGARFTIADSISYEAQTTDSAQARIPDATGDWQSTTTPTPGATNEASDDA